MSQECDLDDCAKNNAITDDSTGEIFCGECGIVFEEKLENQNEIKTHNLEEFMKQNRTGPKQTLTIHDKGLNSIIGKDVDSAGKPLNGLNKMKFRRLRLWDNRSKTRNSSQRTLVKSLAFLNGLQEKLGIPKNTVEATSSLFRKALKDGLTGGRNTNSLMAAALYACCRQTMTPRSLQDISKMGNISKKSVQKQVRTLIRELNLDIPQYDTSYFLVKMANNLGINEKTKRFALKILEDIANSGSSAGKNPMGQAAASLYLASMLKNEPKNQRDFAKMAGVSSVTLRNRTKTLRRVLNL